MKSEHPSWLRKKISDPSPIFNMKSLLDGLHLHTVCESAECPNQAECFSSGTATFLILGDICTRNCRFCAIKKGHPKPLDQDEPQNLAEAVNRLQLKHVVITSVTRDDLPDGGATHFAKTIEAVKQTNPQTTIEVLIPDFQGSASALKTTADSSPEIINHNVETIPRLYPEVRPKADYHRSLELLQRVKGMNPKITTKSGLMLGLGETHDEVIEVLENLRQADCDLLTIGQYLRPSPSHHVVCRYVPPREFEEYGTTALKMGFKGVASAPLVRSSFNAAEMYNKLRTN
jgi:lipoic acid synthetase